MNRPADLRRALESIASGTRVPHQVIVSDDGDPDSTMAVVSEFGWVLYQEGPHKGLGANRNACLKVATGTHVAFIDDDVILPGDFVKSAEECALQTGASAIATGYEMRHDQVPPWKVTPHDADWMGFQRKPPGAVLHAVVINAAVFPRELFETVKFDERLKYGCEEVDVARHAVHLGYSIDFFDTLWVHHYPSPINRAGYARHLTTSRLYATMKAYLFYDRHLAKAAAYALVASSHVLASAVVRRRNIRAEMASIMRAGAGLWSEFRDRRSEILAG